MKQVGKYILFDLQEFEGWLTAFKCTRDISHIQQHHTWLPDYKDFNGDNHFKLCDAMERYHTSPEVGMTEIAQNFTTFSDGTIMVCRNLNTQPAGIKFANGGGICIENVGNFDIGKDKMTAAHKETIIGLTKLLLTKFKLTPDEYSLVYHHWFDLKTGERKPTDEPNSIKTCPGTSFFGGNTLKDYHTNFLPLFN